ncbi:MAG: UPF0182 family protein [Desulfobacterales bacterium]
MKNWKKKIVIPFGILATLLIAVLLLKIVFLDMVVAFWWFKSMGLGLYYFMRLVYRYAVFLAAFLVFFGLFFINFWLASRYVGANGQKAKDRDLLKLLRTALMKLYLPLSLLLAIPIALPLYRNWETSLLYFFGGSAGVQDPLFGRDISYYLLSLPVYNLVQKELLAVFGILFLGVAFLYWYEHRLLARNEQQLSRGAKVHLSALVFIVFLLLAWGFMLERYQLLYENAHQPIFFGPGFVEMRVILPFIWLSIFFLMATALGVILCIHRRRGFKYPAILFILFGLSALARDNTFFKDQVEKYFVEPNQAVRERPYIQANIDSTLAAYKLDQVATREYETLTTPVFDSSDPDLIRRLQNIPVWDREMLDDVFRELQGIRTYYTFPSIDVDRYKVEGNYRQVYLGAREINLAKMPESAQNWVNLHLQYTHGNGVVMIPAAQAGDDPLTWFVKNIPPQSDYGLTLAQPEIYYGLEDKPYLLVPNEVGEIGTPAGDEEKIVHYRGQGGVRCHSLWRKLLFSIYFKDRNLFFTTKTSNESRILFRRNILERIEQITPFFRLDQDPYIVVTPKGLFWIQDAYTTSTRYPLAPAYDNQFNYIRNSLKIVVDAFNGRVQYFISDPADPIIQAYRRMYPTLFKDMADMPAGLKPHVRYPKDMFVAQMTLYTKYHQVDANRFYRQEDIWEFSKFTRDRELVPMKPYYLTLDLIEPGKEEFLLIMPMAPFGRENLRSLVIAGCDGENYGRIFTYSFPRDQQVYGPSQINATINQDTVVSEQFTLWDQEGSEVLRGKMIIEPTNGLILYIQPVYLQQEGQLRIPQLKRVIMAHDDAVVMSTSLEEAAAELEKKLRDKFGRQKRRFPRPPHATPKPHAGGGAETAEPLTETPPLPVPQEPSSQNAAPPEPPAPSVPKTP